MSSREIADLTGKLHLHVVRDIKAMLAGLGEVATKFGGYYTASNGKANPCFNLPKRETLILVSGYSVTLRTRIIDRWMELEARGQMQAPALPNFSDPVAATRAWANEFEAKQIARAQVEELKPLAIVGSRAVAHNHNISRFVRTLPGVNTMKVKADRPGL